MFFKKRKDLSNHEIAIAIMYLTKTIKTLEDEVSKYNSILKGNWTIIHDIKCLKATIKYLE